VTPTSRYQAVMDSSTQVLQFLVDGHHKIGTHPYYLPDVFGVEACQAAASRCDQEMVELAHTIAWAQHAIDIGQHHLVVETSWAEHRSMTGRAS
jgi:hypothetical protein